MRDKAGRTEQVLGVALLVFVAVVTLAFGLTTGLFGHVASRSNLGRAIKSVLCISDQPLFTVDRSKIKPPDSREIRAVKGMLPDSYDGSERTNPEVLSARSATDRDVDAALLKTAEAFGAGTVYRAVYGCKAWSVGALIVDAGEPANAFGLWRSREPADAKHIDIGRAGWEWQADGQASSKPDLYRQKIGFWAGRYYIELDLSNHSEPRDLKALAKIVAAQQLVYGGPFWAESVLPTDGRVVDSLRFVKCEPLGLKVTADCWLANYAGGLTLGVMKPTAEQREAVLAAVKGGEKASATGQASEPQAEAPGQVAKATASAPTATGEGHESEGQNEETSKPLASARGSDKAKVIDALPAGEYVFVAAGPDAGAVAAALKPLIERWSVARPAAGASATADATPTGSAKTASQGPFIDLGDPAVLAPTKIERYTDNLYEKIDGREPQFRQFGFIELRVGTYQHVPKQAAYDAYLFDMGEPVNAMGIYMTERSGSSHSVKIGRDGYVSGASVYFWKGKYYVYILGPADAGEEAAAVAERIARGMEKTLDDKREPFWAEKLLPAEDRLPDSLSYRASSGLGFDFLQRMFVTSYKTGDKTYQMYIIRADSPQAAKMLFDKFAEATAKYDKIVGRTGAAGDAGGETVVSESLGVYGAAFHRGVYFGGVAECEDRALAEKRAGALRESLPGK